MVVLIPQVFLLHRLLMLYRSMMHRLYRQRQWAVRLLKARVWQRVQRFRSLVGLRFQRLKVGKRFHL